MLDFIDTIGDINLVMWNVLDELGMDIITDCAKLAKEKKQNGADGADGADGDIVDNDSDHDRDYDDVDLDNYEVDEFVKHMKNKHPEFYQDWRISRLIGIIEQDN